MDESSRVKRANEALKVLLDIREDHRSIFMSHTIDSIFEKDFEWVNEVVEKVKSMSSLAPARVPPPIKEEVKEEEEDRRKSKESEKIKEEDEEEEEDEKGVIPVLLPKTPKPQGRKGVKRRSEEAEPPNKVIKTRSRAVNKQADEKELNVKETSPDIKVVDELREDKENRRGTYKVSDVKNGATPEEKRTKQCYKPTLEILSPILNKENNRKSSQSPPNIEEKPCDTTYVKTPARRSTSSDRAEGRSTCSSDNSERKFVESQSSSEKEKHFLNDAEKHCSRISNKAKSITRQKSYAVLPESTETASSNSDNEPSPRRSARLEKKSSKADIRHNEEKDSERRSTRSRKGCNVETKQPPIPTPRKPRRSSLPQYKNIVKKAVRTSIAADQKKQLLEKHNEALAVDEKYATPLAQRTTISRTVSATTSSGMRTYSIPRTQSTIRWRSPVPSRSTLTATGNYRVFLSSKSTSKLNSRCGTLSNIKRSLTTFLPQKPPKPTAEDLKIKAEEEILKKRQKEVEAIKRKEEIAKQKIKEKKSQREARLKKVMENKKMLKKQQSASDVKDKDHPEKLKAIRLVESERRKQENQARLMEAEERRLREEAKEREKQEQEKARQIELLKLMAQQERALKEKKLEEARALQEQAKKEATRKIQEAKLHQKLIKKDPPKIEIPKNINTTVTVEDINSYDMTPAPEERSPLKLKDPNDYDIKDLKSDDDTDDEDRPRKSIPKWAEGPAVRQAVMSQIRTPPDVDLLFGIPPMPDLTKMFSHKKQRFFKRTSSACWNSAPSTHKFT